MEGGRTKGIKNAAYGLIKPVPLRNRHIEISGEVESKYCEMIAWYNHYASMSV